MPSVEVAAAAGDPGEKLLVERLEDAQVIHADAAGPAGGGLERTVHDRADAQDGDLVPFEQRAAAADLERLRRRLAPGRPFAHPARVPYYEWSRVVPPGGVHQPL